MALISKIKGTNNTEYNVRDDVSVWGGRNLLKGTSNEWQTITMPTTSYYSQFGTDYELQEGETYTFSVIVERVSTDSNPINIHLGNGTIKNYTHDIYTWRKNNITSGEKIVLIHTIEHSDRYNSDGTTFAPYFAWRIRNEQKAITVRYKQAKLEKGTKPTDWSPAPEDIAYVNGECLELLS